MTLAVMSRATLGHTGQPLTASWATQTIYLAIILAAVARICAVLDPADDFILLHIAACAWVLAFFGYVIAFGPLLLTAPDGRISQFPRAMCRVRARDGRAGTGWVEWNRNASLAP